MQDKRKMWEAEAAELRAKLGEPGIADREAMRTHSGIDFLNGIMQGEFPPAPIADLLDVVGIEATPGRVVFQGTPGWKHYNPAGTVHGGYTATLLDTAVACAIHSMLPAGKAYTTLELKVNFVRAMTKDTGPVRAEGKVVNVGGQVGIAEGRIMDADGKLLAFATTTCLIFAV